MEIKTKLNEKQAKHFEFEGELWASDDMGWYNGPDDAIFLLYQDTKGFILTTVDAEGIISRRRFNFEQRQWYEVSE